MTNILGEQGATDVLMILKSSQLKLCNEYKINSELFTLLKNADLNLLCPNYSLVTHNSLLEMEVKFKRI